MEAAVHGMLLDQLRDYALVGGMPESVARHTLECPMPGCGSKTPATEKRLTAQSGEIAYEWFTPYLMGMGLDRVRGVLKNKGAGANFRSRLAMQVALVRTDNPDAPATVGTETLTGSGRPSPTRRTTGSSPSPGGSPPSMAASSSWR